MEKKSIDESIRSLLEEFNDSVEGINASAVASSDGLPISSAIKEDINLAVISALGAAVQGSSRSVMEQMGLKNLTSTMINADDGKILVFNLNDVASLIAVTDVDANLGLVLLSSNRFKNKIMNMLEGML